MPEGSLGHPDSEMVTIRQLFSEHGIENEADLLKFLTNTLPKNKEGHVLLPQINMKHAEKQLTLKHPDMLVLRLEDELQAEVIGLKVMIEESTDENKRLNRELSELRESMLDRMEGYMSLEGAYGKLEQRLEDMDSMLAIYSYQIKELKAQNAELEATGKQRQEELESLVKHILPLVREASKQEKSEPLESSTLYKEMVRKQSGKKYDPELLDLYSLEWKAPKAPENSYVSSLSQLTSMCKRPPAKKF